MSYLRNHPSEIRAPPPAAPMPAPTVTDLRINLYPSAARPVSPPAAPMRAPNLGTQTLQPPSRLEQSPLRQQSPPSVSGGRLPAANMRQTREELLPILQYPSAAHPVSSSASFETSQPAAP